MEMNEFITAIEKMTVLELSELVKALEEKFGVSAAAVAAPAASNAAAPAAAAGRAHHDERRHRPRAARDLGTLGGVARQLLGGPRVGGHKADARRTIRGDAEAHGRRRRQALGRRRRLECDNVSQRHCAALASVVPDLVSAGHGDVLAHVEARRR